MSWADAAVSGILSPEEAAAAIAAQMPGITARVPVTTLAPAPTEEPPPPVDPGPTDDAITAEAAARAEVNALLERRLAAVAQMDSTERRIEAARAAGDVDGSREDRDSLVALRRDVEEYDLLVERAHERHDATVRTLGAARNRDDAAAHEARIVELRATLPEVYGAIANAVAVIDRALDGLDELTAAAIRETDGMLGLPEPYWPGPRSWSGGRRIKPNPGTVIPSGFRFDRAQAETLRALAQRLRRMGL